MTPILCRSAARVCASLLFAWLLSLAAAARDWPMLAADAGRSGATADEIRPPFARKWYRLFADEGLMSGVQPVVADGKVVVGTLRGIVHAMDAETGQDAWTFQAGGPILHTCAAAEGKVFFGCADGKVYALGLADGRRAWSAPTGAAIWNAPVVHDGAMLIGSRDGRLYAFAAGVGTTNWTASTGGPLLNSPAIDAARRRVYIGSEDMHVYAFDLRDGGRVWRSPKLPGATLRGYHPVIAPDGSVMVTVAPVIALDRIQPVLLDMVKEIFGDFASWRHKKNENDRLRAANFKKMDEPGTYQAQLDYLRRRLGAEPSFQTFSVLDPASGRQKFVPPIVYAESMNGPAAPPVVTAGGRVVVKFQALLRSRYEHYSPFLNVGFLDTTNGHIAPIMDQTRTYGWHDSLLLVHDEQCQLSAAGRVLINTHQDNVNALDLVTLKGYGDPLARNIHEPQPGEALAIWSLVLAGQPLPPGKEWLARGTAVYGGGSVLDTPVSVAGDSFYYLPTHEINAGAAIIAYRATNTPEEKPAALPAARLTDDAWATIQSKPWEWDTLAMPRLNHVLAALPGKVPGSHQLPLTNEAAAAVAKIPDSELDRFIWEAPDFSQSDRPVEARWRSELARAVRELISAEWRPWVFPAGKFPEEAYRFFNEPTETLYTLALAFPHLDPPLQDEVKKHVTKLAAPGGALEGPTGRRLYAADGGEARPAYDMPPERLLRISENLTRTDLARLYPLWLWARVSGDWARLEKDWPRLKELLRQPPNKMEEDCRNGHLAGLIAWCRLARHTRDSAAEEAGVQAVRAAMRERLRYELAHTRGGLIYPVPVQRAIFSRWEHLTPDVGRFLAHFAGDIHRELMRVSVDYHRPSWWLAWNVELMMRNECPYSFPTLSAQVFAARAVILGDTGEKLAGFIDLPWCRGDEYYIQKIALTLAAGNVRFEAADRAR